MKRHFITLAAVLIFTGASAAVLSPDAALRRAMDSSPRQMSPAAAMTSTVSTTFTDPADGLPTAYLFTNPQGWILTSADDLVPAVIGYGNSPMDRINPAMQWWVEQYGMQISAIRSAGTSTGAMLAPRQADRYRIAPLIATRWDQGDPYNRFCPVDNSYSRRAYTGCLATAMAQVMNYHRYPEHGQGSHTYLSAMLGQTMSMDFSQTSFDWDNMLNTYGANATSEQTNAVALLMQACGISLEMDYSGYASGARDRRLAYALYNHFNYDPAVSMVHRRSYFTNEWEDMLFAQLAENQPVILVGVSASGSGHSFICDGFDGDAFFHINWGWSGVSDGWFLMSSLDPYTQGIGGSTSGYNADLNATINIRPPREGSGPEWRMIVNREMSLTMNGPRPRFAASLLNVSVHAMDGAMMRMRITNPAGVTVSEASMNRLMGTLQHNFFADYASNIIMPTDLADGSYRMYPEFKTGDSDWIPITPPTFMARYFDIEIRDGKPVIATYEPYALSVSNYMQRSPMFLGQPVSYTMTLTNPHHVELTPTVHLAISDSRNNVIAIGDAVSLSLKPGESRDIHYKSEIVYTSRPSQSATYRAVFMQSDTYVAIPITEEYDFRFEDYPGNPQINNVNDCKVNGLSNATNVNPRDIDITFTLSLSKGYFGDRIPIYITEEGTENRQIVYTEPLFISGAGEVTAHCHACLPDLKAGKRYFVEPIYNANWFAGKAEFTVSTTAKAVIPETPANFAVNAADDKGSIHFNWDKVTRDTEGNTIDGVVYRIYRQADTYPTPYLIGSDIQDAAYTYSAADANTPYALSGYCVEAVKFGDSSGLTSFTDAIATGRPLALPFTHSWTSPQMYALTGGAQADASSPLNLSAVTGATSPALYLGCFDIAAHHSAPSVIINAQGKAGGEVIDILVDDLSGQGYCSLKSLTLSADDFSEHNVSLKDYAGKRLHIKIGFRPGDRLSVKGLTVSGNGTTAIESILTDSDMPIEIFSVDGKPVGLSIEALPRGVYIVRQGSSVSKIAR